MVLYGNDWYNRTFDDLIECRFSRFSRWREVLTSPAGHAAQHQHLPEEQRPCAPILLQVADDAWRCSGEDISLIREPALKLISHSDFGRSR